MKSYNSVVSSCIQKDAASYSRGSDNTGTVRISVGTQSILAILARACLKIKNCTKHVFLSPFHDRIKKKGAFICQDVMN